jgi:hypothetical protein
MEDGASAEIAVVGNDGVVGVSLYMGGETTTSRAVVQSAGYAYRLPGPPPPHRPPSPPDQAHPDDTRLSRLARQTQVA